ncbi:MAG: pyruvate:ferredoxin (flavodoxin) oxidoreductase [Bacilli bacterium]|nr:pyruvate:ferredoxin (flavodoxin) oxidoreductase [Bacilli bacterium]
MEFKKYFLSVDGNTAVAETSYQFTEVAGIYPITPSSPMAEVVDQYAAKGKKNAFGNEVNVVELQSEAGASGAVHGALQAGALAVTYTASQGLLLMIPNIYKWVGEELPAVLHVAARSLASRALCIFGDHQDVYACRQTGAAMICSHSVQEIADLAPLAHLVAIEASHPVIHFFDGFRTSHEVQNVEFVEEAGWQSLLNREALANFKAKALNPHGHAVTRGGAENDDIYFQGLEAQNLHNDHVVDVACKYFEKVSELTGRHYAPFTYYGASDATKVIVAMGSVTETALEVVDALNAKGEKVGLVKVHLYRPFSAKHLMDVIPASVKKVAVLDRTKEPGSIGEPLYLDFLAACDQTGRHFDVVLGGRYGLGSKDTQPKHVKSVYDFLDAEKNWNRFTVGIKDDVTNLSVPVDESFHVKADYTSCLFYGLGSDGTVSANKSSIKIIGDATGQYAQAYFAYDSRKAGGVTRSHLRFGKNPIHSTYYVEHADFISCSLDSYIYKFDMLKNLKDGGTFLLNTDMTPEALIKALPNRVKKQLVDKHAKFYIIDANKLAMEIGMGRHTNTTLQASFFKLNPDIMPYEEAQKWMKKFAEKSYAKKGQEIVEMNWKAIDAGADGLIEVAVDPEWSKLEVNASAHLVGDEYFDNYVNVIGALDGYDIPVSEFRKHELEDGTMRNNITFTEDRSIADRVPLWHKENCIQCNQCAFICPHATIRPFLLTEEEVNKLPEDERADVLDAMGGPNVKGLKFRIQVSPRNCVGCGLCMTQCPGKPAGKDENGKMIFKKALTMEEAKSQFHHEAAAKILYKEVEPKEGLFPTSMVKGCSFLTPYQEVSGACAGCGETPYYRLVSQLFGKDMLVANATGCSSIYNGSTPLTPFVTDKDGNGVAWANSLFEDNAEYGFGMRCATDFKLLQILTIIEANKNDCEDELKAVLEDYADNIKNRAHVRSIINKLVKLVEESKCEGIKALLDHKADLLDKSVWIVGGDGWAYDIGYGGLDHVIADEKDVNILVLDTEVYSNTGGQSSKSTQTGAIAKFCASGKKTAKKNLALIAMTYEHVYVAQISLGANPTAAIKAIQEAESYNGPSLIICYAPCANHGIKGGLQNAALVEKEAVECGYFPIFRFDPRLAEQGKSPLTMDCKEPDYSKFRQFLLRETRYSQLPKVNPAHAEELLTKCEEYAKRRYKAIRKFGE